MMCVWRRGTRQPMAYWRVLLIIVSAHLCFLAIRESSSSSRSSSLGAFLPVLAGVPPVESSDPMTPSPLGSFPAESSKRLLVLVSSSDVQTKTHTQFLNLLKHKEFDVDVKLFDDNTVRISQYGEYLYDFIIILEHLPIGARPSPGNQFAGLSLQTLVEFIDHGGSMFVATGSSAGGSIRKLANEVGIDFDKPGSYVIDHFEAHSGLGEGRSAIAIATTERGPPIIDRDISDPILYEGISHLLNPSNALTIPILRAPATAYCSETSTTYGQDILLVSTMQARNGARVTFTGSSEMLSNTFFELSQGNQQFVTDLVDWTFQQKGVVMWSNIKHHKEGETVSPHMYRINDTIVFSIDLHELKHGNWVPYKANDVQVEFTMLDPYIRAFLNPPPFEDSPTFTLKFRVPDRYGVFKFVIHHQRLGYNTLHVESLAPLRNFKHNDYERFLLSAYPYYGSAICSMLGVFVFSLIFLYHSGPKDLLLYKEGKSGSGSANGDAPNKADADVSQLERKNEGSSAFKSAVGMAGAAKPTKSVSRSKGSLT